MISSIIQATFIKIPPNVNEQQKKETTKNLWFA